MSQTPLVAAMEHVVQLVASNNSTEDISRQLLLETRESELSPRDVALASACLTTAFQSYLKEYERPPQQVVCDFCHKAQGDVRKMIAGPTANICGECVAICDRIVKGSPGTLRRSLTTFLHRTKD